MITDKVWANDKKKRIISATAVCDVCGYEMELSADGKPTTFKELMKRCRGQKWSHKLLHDGTWKHFCSQRCKEYWKKYREE